MEYEKKMKYALIQLKQCWSNSDYPSDKYCYRVGYYDRSEINLRLMYFFGFREVFSMYDSNQTAYFVGRGRNIISWDCTDTKYKEVSYTYDEDHFRDLILVMYANKVGETDVASGENILSSIKEEFINNFGEEKMRLVIKDIYSKLNLTYYEKISESKTVNVETKTPSNPFRMLDSVLESVPGAYVYMEDFVGVKDNAMEIFANAYDEVLKKKEAEKTKSNSVSPFDSDCIISW